MNITVYLPDEIGSRAKEAELNFSGMLRAAVEAELARRDSLAELAGKAREVLLDLESESGRLYKGRFVGTLVCSSSKGELYVTDDERLLGYCTDTMKLSELSEDDPRISLEDEIRWYCEDDDEYIEVLGTLGLDPIIDV